VTEDVIEPAAQRLDPRRNAFRADLAAKPLEGKVSAPRYAAGEAAFVARASVPLRKAPEDFLSFETEALFGESLTIYDEAAGWAWVQLARDGYVGYVPSEALRRGTASPTHKIQVLGTFLYGRRDIKSPPLVHLAMNALVATRGGDQEFLELEDGCFVYARHAAPIEKNARDFVEVAERFIGVPYLWGGRTRIGLDCSGLVQTALQAAGLNAPRDTDMQQNELGEAVSATADLGNLRRGDLVFWKGHVGIMVDGALMVHANAHHMMVAIEPLPEAAERIARTGNQIIAIKRLSLQT
jgi:cell wall-associated NlpC family hydrolase